MRSHKESHFAERTGWLRAAVLGANDGIISTSSLIMGVAATGTANANIVIAGVAGLVAGSMSMAAGEYVSVSSQSDMEKADLSRERRELARNPELEQQELVGIYIDRGLDPALAGQVAAQLTKHDALAAHARDELGLSEKRAARPVQAAIASSVAFGVGAGLPLLALLLMPPNWLLAGVAGSSIVFLALLGWLAAYAGGANRVKSTARVTFWGALAMAITVAVGSLFGA